jgi:hypothetical protein
LERKAADSPDESTLAQLNQLRQDLDELDAKAPAAETASEAIDPDDARRVVDVGKSVRGRIGRLERRVSGLDTPAVDTKFVELIEAAEEVSNAFGSQLEKQQVAMLTRELERAAGKGDDRSIKRICEEVEGLRWRILFRQDWFWREIFESLSQHNAPFLDHTEARRLIERGTQAMANGDGQALRNTVRALWELQPKGSADISRERALASGLRKY